MDSAFFSDEIVTLLNRQGVEFTISVPFERHAKLKSILEQEKSWSKIDNRYSTSEILWTPKSWSKSFRIIGVQRRDFIQKKGVIQLDLFIPYKSGYDYTVVVTNKKQSLRRVMEFH